MASYILTIDPTALETLRNLRSNRLDLNTDFNKARKPSQAVLERLMAIRSDNNPGMK